MAKIDFDSDAAPFSGAVLPTIEDVAALAHDDGREEVSPKGRGGGGSRRGVLLFANFILGALALGFAHFFMKIGGVEGASSEVPVELSAIPFRQAQDIRFVEKNPRSDTVEFASEIAKNGGKRVVFFYEKNRVLPESAKREMPGVEFFGAEEGALFSDGILLDGYRWFPLPP